MSASRSSVILLAIALLLGHDAAAQSEKGGYPARKEFTAAPARPTDKVEAAPHTRPPTGEPMPRLFLRGTEYRTIDGSNNNVLNPAWGQAGAKLIRRGACFYADDVSSPAGPNRPSARAVSNAVCAQSTPRPNRAGASDFVWMWGQLLDHDLSLVETANPTEPFFIPVPMGDPQFDPASTGGMTITLNRSHFDPATGGDPQNPREQVNALTAYIDASNVYGSDTVRANWLRANDGTGRLKTSAGNMMPFNTDGLPNAGGPNPAFFLAGDVRANEQIALTALHTLFVREHNRLADEIIAANPQLSDEEIYQQARAIVGAQMQVITYNEFLPVLLGENALKPYVGYDPNVDVGIENVFATACYRVGHTMLSPFLHRVGADGDIIPEGDLRLREAFFALPKLTEGGGIEPLFRGAADQLMQDIDPFIVDDVRNFLFGQPGAGGFDLASLNIQRGRDHGLSSYNKTRSDFGLLPVTDFAGITNSTPRKNALASVYDNVEDIDLWVGALAEDQVPGAMVGELLRAVMKDQFERLRDGDRFWYQLVFSGPQLAEIESTTLADIIRRNTTITDEIQDRVFIHAQGPVPAASTWGLIVLSLLLASGGTAILLRRRAANCHNATA